MLRCDMTDLLLVGASGLAREVVAMLRVAHDKRTIAVLDDREELWGSDYAGIEVLGGVEQVQKHPSAEVTLCVGSGALRAQLALRLAALGLTDDRYARLVHQSVHLPEDCEVGPGSVVLAGVVLTADVRVGSHVVVMPNVTLTHDNRVESFATLCAGVTLGGGVQIGRTAYLGMNSCVRENRCVGAGSTLGMGAVLLDDLPAGAMWAGVPAMQLLSRAS
jgi:sugar O-acyltransferase (sialic acid O-acetyltransferase NeuD family)